MRFDINETLLRHIATGGGAAYALRRAVDPKLRDLISELFGARSDIRRLDRAQEVARAILGRNDFADVMELRHIVAQQELRRLIGYSKQQDHTSHTAYLYLLGIWFFDHVSIVHSSVTQRSGAKPEADVCEWFLNQWVFASLLHDIGYAYYDLSDETKEDRSRIDDIYSWTWLEKLFGSAEPSARRLKPESLEKLRAVHRRFQSRHLDHMPPGTSTYVSEARLEVLKRLASAPWLAELNGAWKGKDVFDVLTLGPGADLRDYAFEVARRGYTPKGGPGFVDHAVASGLLLFQYTSYWYWLMNELRDDPVAREDVGGGFGYDPANVDKWLVPACRAVAYHNVVPSVPGASGILSRITLAQHPILYLAIVCDELQRWDRYPAGDATLRAFQETAAGSLEGEDIELTCSGTDTKTATFRIGHGMQAKIVNEIQKSLQTRLPDYGQLVEVAEGA